MAKKKKENSLSYLQMPLPEGGKYSKMTKVAFGGLDKRYTHDSNSLSMEKNISTNEYPYLTPSQKMVSGAYNYSHPISMSAFDNFLIVVYYENDMILVDYIDEYSNVHTGILQADEDKAEETKDIPRSIVQFNVYDVVTDPVTGSFIKKLLFFPDKVSMFMNVEAVDDPEGWDEDKLNSARTDVMYCSADTGYHYVVKEIKSTDDEGNVTFTRELVNKHEVIDDKGNKTTYEQFICDGMGVDVQEYYNKAQEIDESGATIYPPPETASHNCYYRNSYNNDIYRWVEYPIPRKKTDEDGKPIKDENGNYEFEKDDDGNYIYDGETAYGWKVSLPPAVPELKYVTVHASRLFGVDEGRVYASGYNDYTNWNLDTVDEYNEANAWCSHSQANTKAGGAFTGITTFQSHVICFKRDFMHEIYNTKNPFRLQDIYAEGAIDNRTIQDVDGKLIFVSEDDVKIYTGSNPRIIGYNLNMPQYTYAVSGTDNRNYYLYCEDNNKSKYLYVYDTYTELWSEQRIDDRIWSFAHNKNGMYMLCDDGFVYQMDTNRYSHEWSFETELITRNTVDIKHIKKLQMLVDIPEKIGGRDNKSHTDDNANMQVYILYDDDVFEDMSSEEKAKQLVYSSNGRIGKFPIRVKPRYTANYGFKLHVEGSGYVKLYELEIFVEAGGDMYVG